MIAVSGTRGAGMASFAARLRGAVNEAPVEEARAAAPVVEELIDQGFLFSRAPTGERWQPRKPPTGSWPLLVKGGLMMAGRRVLRGRGELVMTLPTPAEYHQRGTRFMVARKIFPEDRLPPGWSARIAAARVAWWRSRLGVGAA